MRKVINNKMYHTDTAVLVAEYSNGLSFRDFKHLYEDLYITKKGQFFLHCQGGPLTKYCTRDGNSINGQETIILYSPKEAFEWLVEHNKVEAINLYFSDKVEEG